MGAVRAPPREPLLHISQTAFSLLSPHSICTNSAHDTAPEDRVCSPSGFPSIASSLPSMSHSLLSGAKFDFLHDHCTADTTVPTLHPRVHFGSSPALLASPKSPSLCTRACLPKGKNPLFGFTFIKFLWVEPGVLLQRSETSQDAGNPPPSWAHLQIWYFLCHWETGELSRTAPSLLQSLPISQNHRVIEWFVLEVL